MPKFQVAGLKQLVEVALQDNRAEFDAKQDKDREAAQTSVTTWLETNTSRWLDVLPKLRKKLNAGEPLVLEDLPHQARRSGWSPELAVMSTDTVAKAKGESKKKAPAYTPPTDLVQFKAALDLITDEYVTSSALKDMGFANLNNRLFRYLDATALRQTVVQ